MTDLDKLIEAVEGGVAPLDAIAKMKLLGLPSVINNNLHEASSAYRGSLDAAKALHETLLPGWEFLDFRLSGYVQISGGIFTDRVEQGECDGNPARAWLIAILEAYRSQCPDKS